MFNFIATGNKPRSFAILLSMMLSAASLWAAPKKLLVVSTTLGFRHSSIPVAEAALRRMSAASGDFTLEFVEQPEGKPADPAKDATEAQKTTYAALEKAWEAKLRTTLQRLSPAALKGYDGVIFLSTTGDLPLPDPQGFLDWIKAGHVFIGVHAASDTLKQWAPYGEMIGGVFTRHGPQVPVECVNEDPDNPATAGLGRRWPIKQEEIYQFRDYDPAKLHDLLILDRHPETGTPGHFAVSWNKMYGKGRVFYTSLGHREDLWDADPALPGRINSTTTGELFRAHLLGGIEWALQGR